MTKRRSAAWTYIEKEHETPVAEEPTYIAARVLLVAAIHEKIGTPDPKAPEPGTYDPVAQSEYSRAQRKAEQSYEAFARASALVSLAESIDRIVGMAVTLISHHSGLPVADLEDRDLDPDTTVAASWRSGSNALKVFRRDYGSSFEDLLSAAEARGQISIAQSVDRLANALAGWLLGDVKHRGAPPTRSIAGMNADTT